MIERPPSARGPNSIRPCSRPTTFSSASSAATASARSRRAIETLRRVAVGVEERPISSLVEPRAEKRPAHAVRVLRRRAARRTRGAERTLPLARRLAVPPHVIGPTPIGKTGIDNVCPDNPAKCPPKGPTGPGTAGNPDREPSGPWPKPSMPGGQSYPSGGIGPVVVLAPPVAVQAPGTATTATNHRNLPGGGGRRTLQLPDQAISRRRQRVVQGYLHQGSRRRHAGRAEGAGARPRWFGSRPPPMRMKLWSPGSARGSFLGDYQIGADAKW